MLHQNRKIRTTRAMQSSFEFLSFVILVIGQTAGGIFWLARLHADVKSLVLAVEKIQINMAQMADHSFRLTALERRVEKMEDSDA